MSKFLKFIVHFVVICTILCVVALAVPPFFGIQTVIRDDPQEQTNLPMGSVTYAIPEATSEVPVGTRILVQEDGKTYRYNIISLDPANGTGIVADPTVSGAETLTVAVKNYVPKIVAVVPYLGYLMMATKSIEGLVILGLAALFLIILYIIAELWRKEPASDEEEEVSDEVYVKSDKELKREDKERAKRMKEEDEELLQNSKDRKKKAKKEKKIVRTGGFVDEIPEEDLDPVEPLPKKKHPVNEQTATSEAHEVLKKEIAAATTEEPAPAEEEVGFLADIEEEEEPVKEEPKETIVYKKMAIPTWTASQLAEKARRDGDNPEVMKESITKVTLFDYSDIISGEDE